MKLGEKVAFCLLTAGRRTQLSHPIFTQPGKGLIVQPCTSPGQHLVRELVADGLLLLHGLRPLVDVHREVVRGGDGTPASRKWM